MLGVRMRKLLAASRCCDGEEFVFVGREVAADVLLCRAGVAGGVGRAVVVLVGSEVRADALFRRAGVVGGVGRAVVVSDVGGSGGRETLEAGVVEETTGRGFWLVDLWWAVGAWIPSTMSREGGEGDLMVRVCSDKRTAVLDTDLTAIRGRVCEDVAGDGAVLEAQ